MLKILICDLVSVAATSVVAGCLNPIAGIARVPLSWCSLINRISVDCSSLSHVLISILSTQSSRSTICSNAIPLCFVHDHVHFLALVGSLNPANLVVRPRLISKALFHLHWTWNFRITLYSLRHLLEIIINVYLRASSLALNVLIEIDHLRILMGFFVQLVDDLSSDLVSEKFVFCKVSIHVFQFLLNQLIFHYVSFEAFCNLVRLILINYSIVRWVLVRWKSLANVYVAEGASEVSLHLHIVLVIILHCRLRMMRSRALIHRWLLAHWTYPLLFPVMVLRDIVRESLMMLHVLTRDCKATHSIILIFQMLGGWAENVLDTLLCFYSLIRTRIWLDETRANIVYGSMRSFRIIYSLFIETQLEIVIVQYLLIT